MKKSSILVLLVFLLLQPAAFAGALCVKVPRANVRSGPGAQYDLVWEIYKYMPFEKVGVSLSEDWYAVKDVDGDIGWMHKKLLTDAFRCTVVKDADAIVRTGPGKRFGKTSWSPAHQYYSFRILKKKGAWVRVKDEWGQTGWIYRSLLWLP
jgi:SH3-like domain-containing protein